MTSSFDRLQPIDSAAEALQFAPSTLRRWRRQGRIHAYTLSTMQWSDVIDFSGARPLDYFIPSEVFREALPAHPVNRFFRRKELAELLEPVLLIRLSEAALQ